MRLIPLIIGAGLVLIGVSSYFNGTPLPIDLGNKSFAVGSFNLSIEFATIGLGVLFVLFSMMSSGGKK